VYLTIEIDREDDGRWLPEVARAEAPSLAGFADLLEHAA
jgi:hypothetical protein